MAPPKPLLLPALVFLSLLVLGTALAAPAYAQSGAPGAPTYQQPTPPGGQMGIPGGGTTAPENTAGPSTGPGSLESTTAPGQDGLSSPGPTSSDRPSLGEFISDPVGSAVKMFTAMLDWVYKQAIGKGLQETRAALAKSAFGLPPPAGPIVDLYGKIAAFVRPVVLIGILLLGVSMMLDSANKNVASATHAGLPRIAFTAAALVFFPGLMKMVCDVSGSLAGGLIGQSKVDDAAAKVMGDMFLSVGPNAGVMYIVAAVAMLVVGLMVVMVCVLKNVFFVVLFVAGPFAIVLRLIPGLDEITLAWFRGILACAMIPILYSVEIMVGSWIVSAPELLAPNATGEKVFGMLAGVCVLWLMWKTPFKVLGWAFSSYSGPKAGKGMVGSVVKTVVVKSITKGIG